MRMEKRRVFLLVSGALFVVPLVSFAQPAQKVRRIAILEQGDRNSREGRWRVFEVRLTALGYVEGKNLVIDRRWADGVDDRLPRLAQELIAGKPEVVLSVSTPAARALMRLTNTIPIVTLGSGDPVATGLVASLSRPGGNVTGISLMLAELMQKRIELLREIKPEARRFGLLGPADNAGVQAVLKQAQDAVRARGLDVRLLDAADAPSIARAFRQLSREPVDALLVASALVMHHRQIVELAAHFGIPAGYVQREFLEAGGLMALSPEEDARFEHAAEYAHRILQGANPADMPVVQPSEFWLGVNLRTARALGLKIPQSILIRANRVLE